MYKTCVRRNGFRAAEAIFPDKHCGVDDWRNMRETTRKHIPIIDKGVLSHSNDDDSCRGGFRWTKLDHIEELLNGFADRHGLEKIGIGGKMKLQQQHNEINRRLGKCPASVNKDGETVSEGKICRDSAVLELKNNEKAQQEFSEEQRTIQRNIDTWKVSRGWKKALAWYVKVGDIVFEGQGAAKLARIFLNYVKGPLQRHHDKYYLQDALKEFVKKILIPRAEASLCGIGRPANDKLWTTWWSSVKNFQGIDA